MRSEYNYLPQQFPKLPSDVLNLLQHSADSGNITAKIFLRWADISERGDFTLGREVGEFESNWSAVVGSKYSIGTSNGTDSIALALEAAGLQPGEEVVTTPVSFEATSGAIIQAGGKPVLVDVDRPAAPNITQEKINYEYAAEKRPKWCVPVLWAGSPERMDKWSGHTILDAAQGINARVRGKRLGELPGITAATYSLHPLKNINVWGDGGMIATNDMGLDHELRSLRNHGLVGRDIWERPGYNHRLSTLQAAVGLEVLETFDFMNDGRQRNAAVLTEGINGINGVTPPYVAEGDTHGWHLYQIIVDAGDRDDCVRYLNAHGVEAKVHYPVPLHLQPALRGLGYARGDFPNAEAFCDQNVTLPINEYLTVEQMEYTVETLAAWARAGA